MCDTGKTNLAKKKKIVLVLFAAIAFKLKIRQHDERRKLWELNQVQNQLLNQLGSQIGVDGIIKKLLETRHQLSLTNTRKVINKGIIVSNRSL